MAEAVPAPDVLIVARSGRQLAQAACAGGYRPVVVDLFGDLDTQAAGVTTVTLSPDAPLGFNARELFATLATLHSTYGALPLVWGSGWEAQPHLLAALAQSWPLVGCPAAILFAVNDPAAFADRLSSIGITHPALAYGRVPASGMWLIKRRGSCGGYGVERAPGGCLTGQREYLQQEVPGLSLSAAFIAGRDTVELLGICEPFKLQSHSCLAYRFSAAVAVPEHLGTLRARVVKLIETLTEVFGLRGLCGIDFVQDDDDGLVLIELNARPTATFDLLADRGEVFRAHLNAAQRECTPLVEVRAMAVCYADDPITVPRTMNWPAWVADRPRPDTRIDAGMPLCSVLASAPTSAEARALLADRFAQAIGLFTIE